MNAAKISWRSVTRASPRHNIVTVMFKIFSNNLDKEFEQRLSRLLDNSKVDSGDLVRVGRLYRGIWAGWSSSQRP